MTNCKKNLTFSAFEVFDRCIQILNHYHTPRCTFAYDLDTRCVQQYSTLMRFYLRKHPFYDHQKLRRIFTKKHDQVRNGNPRFDRSFYLILLMPYKMNVSTHA